MNVTNLDSVIVRRHGFRRVPPLLDGFRPARDALGRRLELFACQDGSSVVLSCRRSVAAHPLEPGATLREATFGVRSAADLRAIGAELEKDRAVATTPTAPLHARDPLGFAIAFRVARRKPVQAPLGKYNTPGRPDRLNTRGQFFDSATPLEMTHTVFMIDEPDKVVPFYVDRLGFIASDSYPGTRLLPARRRIQPPPQPVPAQRRQETRLPSRRVRARQHSRAVRRRSQHDAPRLEDRARTGPPSDLLLLLLVLSFAVRRRGRVRLRLRSRRRQLGARHLRQTPEAFAEWCLAEGMADSLLYKGIQTGDTIKSKS